MIDKEDYFESLRCIKQAASELGLKTSSVTKDNLMLDVEFANRQSLRFWLSRNPLNNAITHRICCDKSYQAELYESYGVNHPKTISIFNPYSEQNHRDYLTAQNEEETIALIENSFTYPLIVKKNRSSRAKGVHLIKNKESLQEIVHKIFVVDSHRILLAQEYTPGREFRVILFNNELLLAYEKVSENEQINASHTDDINPLHSGKGVKVTDPELLQKLGVICSQAADAIKANYLGVDVMLTKEGKFYVIESNGNPMCRHYNQANGRSDFTKIYKKILSYYANLAETLPHLQNQNLRIHRSHRRLPQSCQSSLKSSLPYLHHQ